MIRKLALAAGIAALIGAGIFFLGRMSVDVTPSRATPLFSLSRGPLGMLGSDGGYSYNFDLQSSLPREEVLGEVQDFLDRMATPGLTLARLREFEFAYQAEIIERGTDQHAFDLMFGKASWRISPAAGPNVLWDTKYGALIAEVGGGYGMVGRMIPTVTMDQQMPITAMEAEALAREAVEDLSADLELGEEVDVFHGYYEFYLLENGVPAGELDVNGFSGQVWFNDWGSPQIGVVNVEPGE